MKNWLPILLFMLSGLVSCHKPDSTATCPVSFSLDSTAHYTLLGNWTFVGFVDTATGAIASPLCGNVASYIIFSDSSASYLPAPYNSYPYHYSGSSLINYYDGSYARVDSTHILLSQTLNTKINGVPGVNQFETRFHSVLQQVNRFQIIYNQLTLYPDSGSTVMRFKGT